eukprot:5025891-Pleurochrysis_carterae.AAC.3
MNIFKLARIQARTEANNRWTPRRAGRTQAARGGRLLEDAGGVRVPSCACVVKCTERAHVPGSADTRPCERRHTIALASAHDRARGVHVHL